MGRRCTLMLMATVLVLGVAFTAAAQELPPAVQELVKQAKAQISEVTADEFKAVIDKGEDAVILDVREPGEYQGGHLPGAISIPRGMLEFKISNQVPDTSTPIYVYCKSGSRSALAAARLQELGYTSVSSMGVGYLGWVEAGYSVER